MLRFAMIGAGGHAGIAILPALRLVDIDLIAIADLNEELARSRARSFGIDRVYTDFEKMLEVEQLDAVCIVGPPALHHKAGIAVLRSGRHLFTEKPPAPDLEGALDLQREARVAGRHAMVGFMKRHAFAYKRAKAISQRAEFGRLTTLRLNYSHWHFGPLRDHLLFMSIHPIDLARFFMGNVTEGSIYKRAIDGEHVVALMAKHENGGMSQITMSAHEPRVQESVELAGESALIKVSNLTELKYYKAASNTTDAELTDETMISMWQPEFAIPGERSDNHVLQGYAGELQNFVEAIETGQVLSPNIDDGVAAMQLVEKISDARNGISTFTLPVTSSYG
ncbi:MAG TPA: Gfo/Idh/MocA family oxidoreductase [Amycolatopsis sp.]|nr:Gfo/Idh/MocA family oxidoreductase [Amycolatopsis sp.]